ncbi:hypothetical protein HNP38_001461 [Chryseobacterium defluvii]|uniref:Glycosyltransferase 2-like domain-containing protein n=1 Tax=Chryseobacterium defluvii TaxID=160396 RepID=A0A840KA08_9FLAO|nr:glycosyltransferase [Chryseobacterium defluvii]MBB4806189.1 hypothetical protein [Chryseobacterium defluvii]
MTVDTTFPILSIIVPTKNRHYYLEYLVNYFHDLDCREVQLVIQDNSDDNEAQKKFFNSLQNLNDDRIIYNYVKESISVIDNSDLALSQATGEYVTFIGDDDIFSKYIIDLVKEIRSKNIDSVLPLKGSYSWPDIKSRLYGNKLSGKFTQTSVSGKITEIKPREEMDKLLKCGGTDILDLPRVYHGIVKLSVLKEIKESTGSFFPGPSPDMANAVALGINVRNHILIDIPYVISGHSKSSGGGMGASGRHIGEISNFKHLPKDTADNWSKEVPFYWSGYTIYAESMLQALKRLRKKDLLKKINYNYLYAMCLVFDTPYKDRIKSTIAKESESNPDISGFKIKLYYFQAWKDRIIFHLRKNLRYILPESKETGVYELSDTFEVAELNDEQILEFYNKNGKQYLNNNLPKF